MKLTIKEGMKIKKNGGKLLVDMSIPPWDRSHRFRTVEKISYDERSELLNVGYRPCIGYTEDLAFYGIPVFIRFHNWRKFDYKNGFTDQYGRPCAESDPGAFPMPLDTAGTLCDYYKSDAMDKFKSSMLTGISMFNGLDMKVVGIAAVVIVGIVMGMYMLMSGGM